ncbi:hypothetical protein I316_07747 [Kwoniella heveanensis BCC8398]|uniref:Uncharacterized protein n=1 Tax=Kwoniella heveanensis BCC8398 TaxID=1296120 RepID=A0A1B9GHT7_9TREE|nr:hypothetical protein I316_07747 [Kwoniella heveanensis BCC8398]
MAKSSAHPLLPSPDEPRRSGSSRSHKTSLALLLALFGLLSILAPSPLNFVTSTFSSVQRITSPSSSAESKVIGADQAALLLKDTCGQAEPILPSLDLHNTSKVWDHKQKIIEWHQGVIRIPTQIYDDIGDSDVDERWEPFGDLHKYLEKTYPLVHKHLKKTNINTYGLIFEWEGSDSSLQPIFLAAHQDVVPVLPETRDQWVHEPFSGHYDGEYIWGRGSGDDKSGLTSILAAIELLLSDSSFKPRRTVILGFGQDEEQGGGRGAPAIRDWVISKYGKDSISLLIDEGSGIQEIWGRTFGLPAVAEKGTVNINVTVSTLGGHSSVPPDHTNIGLTARLITEIEDHPHSPSLNDKSPIWGFLQCAARYADEIPQKIKDTTLKSIGGDKDAFEELPGLLISSDYGGARKGPGQGSVARALISTTQATDIIRGGLKANALPEIVSFLVNNRIDVSSSVSELESQIYNVLLPRAQTLNLSISGFGQSWSPSSEARGHVQLGTAGNKGGLDPAPITPTGLGVGAWELLAGTSRGVWASRPEVSEDGRIAELGEGDDLTFAPYLGTGNTDTSKYWDLTRHIYRWRHFPDKDNQGAHTINEHVSANSLIEFVRFYQAIILNADASDAI